MAERVRSEALVLESSCGSLDPMHTGPTDRKKLRGLEPKGNIDWNEPPVAVEVRSIVAWKEGR